VVAVRSQFTAQIRTRLIYNAIARPVHPDNIWPNEGFKRVRNQFESDKKKRKKKNNKNRNRESNNSERVEKEKKSK
jgi:hypothetical protein